jgi:hypothetical protein
VSATTGASRAQWPLRQRISHPLFGANPPTLGRVLARNGLPRTGLVEIAAAGTLAALKSPASFTERIYVNARRHSLGVKEPPVFILGHWRSGTTHLFNVMSRDSRWGYVSPFATALPWDFLLLGRVLEPVLARLLPRSRFFDNVKVERDSPQEDEVALANMTPLSFYNALYFPSHFRETFDRGVFFDGCSGREIRDWQRMLRYYYDKLSIRAGGRQLLIKNPVYTARAAMLAQMWPGSKFVHIHRNPYEVFFSMRNFFERMFAQFALEPWDNVDIDGAILDTYTRMMDLCLRDTARLPEGSFVELSFDSFQKQPLEEVQRIYDALGIRGFETSDSRFRAYLASVAGYRKNTYNYPPETVERISERFRPYIERWGYKLPGAASGVAVE